MYDYYKKHKYSTVVPKNKLFITDYYSCFVWETASSKLILSNPNALKAISLFWIDTFSKQYYFLRKKDKS